MSALKKLVIFLAILVIALPASFAGVVYTKLHKMKIDDGFEMLETNKYKFDDEITNILLVGSDARPGEEQSRSDAMMILTVDRKNNKLKLTSLGRDTYVNIPGHGFQKLTHAYSYGKEKLLIDTIEENFELDIQNYAKVDFISFMDIVDTIGGIEVNILSGELQELNKFIYECYKFDRNHPEPIQYIKKPGTQTLMGYQALSFARIRHNDGTMERDNRQRLVIEAILKKAKTMPVSKYSKLLNAVLPYVTTNMDPADILYLAKDILSIGDLSLETLQFPFHPENEVRLQEAGYVIPYEKYENKLLHNFIFDDKKPTKLDIENADKDWEKSGQKSQYISDPEYSNR
ncbi:LCP family protein [Peptostreptococcus faecalis]|uniref:LCP family protein n=1 Tax=Peptostreptococcus faecalis TaxID=2045015 RepID=UPI000C7A8450|nr:LCP family protein [Peptostreptococcus faecalis]